LTLAAAAFRSPRWHRDGAAAFEAVFAILIGAGLGYLVDDRFGTSPLYLFVGIAIGFGAFVLRLVRLGRALQPSDGEPSQPSQDDGSTGRE
jgi:F0F1-type ATP synthase assembly protein I